MKTGKKLLSLALAILVVFSVFSITFVSWSSAEGEGKKITDYSKGDIIEFGWYPQSRETEDGTVNALTYAGGSWLSYNYYSGTGDVSDGNMTSSNYMRYKDVIYNGNKYRGVVFDSYRPYYIGDTLSEREDFNGYNINTVYWFKYEPIQWRVLDPSTGLVICETIIDSQAYNNYILESGKDEYGYTVGWGDPEQTYYANNYEKSSIREWLNNNFYNTAFYYSQKDIIQYTKLDNKAYSADRSAYDSATTIDKIFLLSYDEANNSNYFSSSTERQPKCSDYAKCQGLNVIKKEYADWLLRSAGYYSSHACSVSYVGTVNYFAGAYYYSYGVRPALKFNLKSNIIQIPIHNHRYMGNFEYPSCTEQGYTLCTCEVCGDSYKDNYIEALGHTDANKDGICDTCKTVFDETLNKKYLVSKATINAPSGKTVDYRNKVKLTATATNVPNGYYVQIFEGTKAVGEKGAATATYTSGELKAGVTYTVKIVDTKGNVFSSDAQNKTVKVDVNAGFFKKLVAFFKGLFGTLPTINL